MRVWCSGNRQSSHSGTVKRKKATERTHDMTNEELQQIKDIRQEVQEVKQEIRQESQKVREEVDQKVQLLATKADLQASEQRVIEKLDKLERLAADYLDGQVQTIKRRLERVEQHLHLSS